MKINSIGTGSLVQNYERAKGAKGAKGADFFQKADSVEFSDTAMSFKNAVLEAQKPQGPVFDPDQRAERVAELKAQVQAGTYRVSGESIAEKIVAGMRIDQQA